MSINEVRKAWNDICRTIQEEEEEEEVELRFLFNLSKLLA
jgi:hypothetical protein